MNANHNSDPEIAALREDISDLQRDFTRLLSHLSKDAANGARHAAIQFEDGAEHLFHDAKKAGAHMIKDVGKQIEDQPLASALLATGIGCIGLFLISRQSSART